MTMLVIYHHWINPIGSKKFTSPWPMSSPKAVRGAARLGWR